MSGSVDTRIRNPFPGLRPFREEEEYLFFGREGQVDAIVDKLAAKRFLAVVGASGSGKSSLVNCGLRPALKCGVMARAGSAWRMAQFRTGGHPIHALARSLAQPELLFDQQGASADPRILAQRNPPSRVSLHILIGDVSASANEHEAIVACEFWIE
jgi:ABC-type glutathione transport system ATPase component